MLSALAWATFVRFPELLRPFTIFLQLVGSILVCDVFDRRDPY